MAISAGAGTRTKRYLASAAAAATLLAGCSGGGHKAGHTGLPTPAAGKVAAFDLGTLSDTYDLNEAVMSGDTLVTTGGSGDVYMLEWDGADHPDVMRMTPQGVISRYVQVNHRVDNGSMVVRSDGSVVFGVLKQSPPTRVGELPVTDKDGHTTALAIPPTSDTALPIGERPDGSLVISEGGDLWSLKDGKSTRLLHRSRPIFTGAVVDPTGTVYSATGDLSGIEAIPVGKAPEHLHVSGTAPRHRTGDRLAAAVTPDIRQRRRLLRPDPEQLQLVRGRRVHTGRSRHRAGREPEQRPRLHGRQAVSRPVQHLRSTGVHRPERQARPAHRQPGAPQSRRSRPRTQRGRLVRANQMMTGTWVGTAADKWGTDFHGRMSRLSKLLDQFPAEEQRLIDKTQKADKAPKGAS